jgi:D-alanyl-D-alanine carboxypeptidase/D-alanyl-D-alanine-endopeptidase (penicillin-binding protein 4)
VPVDWIVLRPRTGDPGLVAHQLVRGREEWSLVLDPPPTGSGQSAGLWLPVRNPGFNAAMAFRALAAGAGIALPLPRPVTASPEAGEVAMVESDPLVDIARAVLHFSNNVATELIGLAASRALTGQALDLAASAAALSGWLRSRTPGDWSGFRLANHSGLSGQSRASPRQLVAIVRAAREGTYAPAELAALLPQVQGRAHADGEAEIDAKAGTMWFANGLAGLGNARNGRPIVFAAFAVDWQQRAALDALQGPRPLQAPEGARAWTLRARELINDLARQWARA